MNDLLSDLNADLRPASALSSVPPVAPPTPALEVLVTPLRWSRPALGLHGGLRLQVGPLSLGVVRR